MGSLTVPILAALPAATALAPMLLQVLAITALAVGMMGLLAQVTGRGVGQLAKQPAADLVPALVLLASPEPSFRSMTGRRAAAPSRAAFLPPSGSIGSAVAFSFGGPVPWRFDLGAAQGDSRSSVAP